MMKALHFRNSHHSGSSIHSPWDPDITKSRPFHHFFPPETFNTLFGILNSAFFSKLTSHIPDPGRTSLFCPPPCLRILVILASSHSRDLTCSSEPPRASNYPEPPDLDSNSIRDQHPHSKNKLFFKINPRIRRRLPFFLVSVVKLDSNRIGREREAYAFHLTGTFQAGSIIYVKTL